ncbi:MAG: SOS response-associated peptidase [Vicingaceae bacterium]
MCFHSKQSKDAQTVEKRFHAKIEHPEMFQPKSYINGFTFPKTPVIANNNKELIKMFQWGLIPFWAKDDSIKKYTLNAKIETIAQKPAFRNSIKNRCLIIADGFFEWKWLDPKGTKKQKYLISLPDESLFAFGGIWSEWVDKATGEIVNTYSIVTTVANEMMSEIHNSKKRMPVILTPENENAWLNGEDFAAFKNINIDLKAILV